MNNLNSLVGTVNFLSTTFWCLVYYESYTQFNRGPLVYDFSIFTRRYALCCYI